MHCNMFTAEGIIRSPVTSCSRRHHSVAAVFNANGIGWEGGDGSAQCRQSVIYDCLVSIANSPSLLFLFTDSRCIFSAGFGSLRY